MIQGGVRQAKAWLGEVEKLSICQSSLRERVMQASSGVPRSGVRELLRSMVIIILRRVTLDV